MEQPSHSLPHPHSILGKIMSAIFGTAKTDETSSTASTTPNAQMGSAANTNTSQNVDVAKMLDGKNKDTSQHLDWKSSIVDLLKLLDLDSSLEARKTLAKELNFTGDMNDSAKMNMFLHQQVMSKLAANGGKLPADLAA